MKKGSIFLDCSTVDVDSAKLVAKNAENHKIIPLDAPVSGGISGAKEGTPLSWWEVQIMVSLEPKNYSI